MSGSWRLAYASVMGSSHVKTGLPCQDASHCEILTDSYGDQIVAAIVSDGAGSAKRAEAGSKLATEVILREMDLYLAKGGILSDLHLETTSHWIDEVRATIREQAKSEGLTPRDFACTLLVALVSDAASMFFQVGDGAIVVGDAEEDEWSYVFWPQHGEYANTTSFITEDSFRSKVQFMVTTNRIVEFAMFTDGIEPLVLDFGRKSVHAPFFNKMFAVMRGSTADGVDPGLNAGLASYLATPAICDRTDDDKSLILGTRRAAASSHESAAS
jgi:hypothetical protein